MQKQLLSPHSVAIHFTLSVVSRRECRIWTAAAFYFKQCVCVCVLPGHQSKGWQLSVTSYVVRKDLWQGHPVKILMFIYVSILPNCWCATRAVQWSQSCNAFLLKLFSVAQGLFCFTQTEDWFEILTGAARMFLANWTVPESVLKLGHQIIF